MSSAHKYHLNPTTTNNNINLPPTRSAHSSPTTSSDNIDNAKKQWNARLNTVQYKSAHTTTNKSPAPPGTQSISHHHHHHPAIHITAPHHDHSPRSSISQSHNPNQHISIVKRKEKLVTAVDDWKPYSAKKRSEQITPVYEDTTHTPPAQHKRASISTARQTTHSSSLKPQPSMSHDATDLTTSFSKTRVVLNAGSRLNLLNIPLTRTQQLKQQFVVLSNHAQQLMQHKVYIYVGIALTLISLYGKDFCDAVLPQPFDLPTAILLCIIFILFSVEILVNCLTRVNYNLSFYQALDIAGTFSLIFDIYFILNLFWNVDSLNTAQSGSTNAHVSRSASLIQVTKFSRVLRVLRLIRIVRVFKFYSNSQHNSVNASKVGLHLSELIDRRVILVLLGLLIVCPFLSVTIPDDLSAAYGLAVMEQCTSLADQATLAANYLFYQTTCIYLQVNSQIYLNQLPANTGLRSYEQVSFSSPGGSNVIFNIRAQLVQSAYFNISLTTFIIITFGVGIVIVSRDVRILVVAPLERMTHMIKKLAGTICVLNGDIAGSNPQVNEAGQIDTSDTSLLQQSRNETNMIEAVIEKMALIFAVQPDSGAGNESKAMQMMAGSKHTEIVTGSSVVSIQVVERPRNNSFDFVEDMGDGDVGGDSMPQEHIHVNTELYPELQSVDGMLNNPNCLHYFKMYMISNLQIENLLFYQEVHRFQTIVSLHTNHMWNHFISSRATVTAINIPSTLRDEIYIQLCGNWKASVFDDAQAQVLSLMSGHWRTFVDSKYCQAYINDRYQQLVARGKIVENT